MSKRTPQSDPAEAEQEPTAPLPAPSTEPAPDAPDTVEPVAPPPPPLKYRYIGTGAGLPDVPARDIRADEPYTKLPPSLYEPV